MLLEDTILFSTALIVVVAILLVLVYFIIILTDLDCDYLNAQECCVKLNFWLLPMCMAQFFMTFLPLFCGWLYLYGCNMPMFIYLNMEYFLAPQEHLGVFDPLEINKRGELRRHMRNVTLKIIYYLILFFIYIYCLIHEIVKGNSAARDGHDYEIINKI